MFGVPIYLHFIYRHGESINCINKMWWNKEKGSQLTDRATEKIPVEPHWAQPKTNIRHWPTNLRFMPGSSLSLKSDPPWIPSVYCCKMTAFHGQYKSHWNSDLSLNSIFVTFDFDPYEMNRLYFVFKSKRAWSGNTAITNCRPTHGTVRKSYRTFTVTRLPKDNNSKATSSLFLVKMIAKIVRTKSYPYQKGIVLKCSYMVRIILSFVKQQNIEFV